MSVRVLHVVTYMGRGGLETMIMNYYRKIDREKVQFDFLVHRQERWDYDGEIEALGGKIYRLPKLNPLSMEYRRQLINFFENHKEYKIVHSHIDCMSAIPLRIAKKTGVPVRIAHAHNSSQDHDAKYLLKLIYKAAIPKYSTKLMACGEIAGEWMFNGAEFRVIKNAIDAKRYRFCLETRTKMRRSLGIQDNEFVVGHVGRFMTPKNHQFLVDIFDKIAKITPAKLLLVGDGELCSNIKEKVSKLGYKDKVIFTGVRSDVADLMQAMDVFVFPSLYEGLPLTIIEAQAAGVEQRLKDLVNQDGGENWAKIRDEMGLAMEEGCGIYRTPELMQKTIDKLAELQERFKRVRITDTSSVFNTDLLYTIELGHGLNVAECMAHSAMARKESRGAHQRLDEGCTERDDVNFLKHTLAFRDADGTTRLEYSDVKITTLPPAKRVYGGEADAADKAEAANKKEKANG